VIITCTIGLALFDSWIEAWGRLIACCNYDLYLCYVHACIQSCAWLRLFRRCALSKVFVCELTWKLGVRLLPQCVLYAGKYGSDSFSQFVQNSLIPTNCGEGNWIVSFCKTQRKLRNILIMFTNDTVTLWVTLSCSASAYGQRNIVFFIAGAK
jgi:hypothetical protein